MWITEKCDEATCLGQLGEFLADAVAECFAVYSFTGERFFRGFHNAAHLLHGSCAVTAIALSMASSISAGEAPAGK